jgi:predicted nicotinamide N-methyase
MAWELECASKQDVPYWATVWPAAQLLAKFLLAAPVWVKNKMVLDLGCGGGIAGLAALQAGALTSIANDIDPIALRIASRNAEANNLATIFENGNFLRHLPPKTAEVILVGDLFYDRSVSKAMLLWLSQARKNGSLVLIADSSRPFAPKTEIEILCEEIYPTSLDLEGRSERKVCILAFQP